MAENDSNVGKEFAQHQKVKANFEREIIAKKNKIESENPSINPLIDIQIIQTEDGKYELRLLGEKIGSLDENNNISYNINGLKAVKEKLEKDDIANYSDLGLPDIEYLEYLEKEKNKRLEEEQGEDKEGQEEQGDEEPEQNEEGDEEKEKEEKEEEEKELDEGQEETKGLLELNLAVLELLNPDLRGCTGIYLNPNTNTLVVKDNMGNECEPEKFGFEEKKVEGGNLALTKMEEEGEISSNENPTKLYAIKGSDYAITTDFKAHHREVNIAVKGRDSNHANNYSVIEGNLAKFDSGDISKYQGQERAGTREGWDAGEKDETNEKAKKIIEGLNSEDKKNFQEEFADKTSNEHGINQPKDLEEVVAETLIEKYGVHPDNARNIAAKVVHEDKKILDIINPEKESGKNLDDYVGYGQRRNH